MLESTSWLQRLGRAFALLLNGTLGVVLWFGFSTDYEWDSFWANFWSPVVAAGIAACTLWWLRPRQLPPRTRRWVRICCLPSLMGGVPYLLAVGPFCCLLFKMDEQSKAQVIQRTSAPDGGKIAEVVFYPRDSARGIGIIRVFLTYDGLPWVRRPVYHYKSRILPETTTDYLTWQDPDTFYLSERRETVRPGWVRWQMPKIIEVAWSIIVDRMTSSRR